MPTIKNTTFHWALKATSRRAVWMYQGWRCEGWVLRMRPCQRRIIVVPLASRELTGCCRGTAA